MSTSIIGAIVGEFFIASQGLGYLLSDQIRLANMPLAWACIVIAAVLGIVLYELVVFTEKRLLPGIKRVQMVEQPFSWIRRSKFHI